mgnify:CR=1 FL=1
MPQREPALLWLRDCALTALVLALCTLTSWVFFRLDFVSSNYILTYILGVMYINVFTSGLVWLRGSRSCWSTICSLTLLFSSASGQTTW